MTMIEFYIIDREETTMTFIEIYLLVLTFILGAVIGSFLNVCIYRIPARISIVKPRSRCGNCGHTLSSYELIPIISWLFLRGKCKSCHTKISFRYTFVEFLQGIIFVFTYLRFGFSPLTLILWLLFSILTVVFFIDLDYKIIPNKVVIFGLITGLIPALYHLFGSYPLYESSSKFAPIVGVVVPTLLMFSFLFGSILILKKSGLGMGDVKIYAVIGLFIGWKLSLLSIWIAFFLGGLFGLIWIFVFKKSSKDYIPFAPFIVIGTFVSVFFGNSIFTILYK